MNDKEKSQELLRLFNYAFIYYTACPPCMAYYYPYDYFPYLSSAVKSMEQESRDFFDDIDNQVPDKLLEILIVLPAFFYTGPWSIYKIKIPRFSAIADKYWSIDSDIVPIFDLQEMKQVYEQALEETPEEEIEMYNKVVDVDFFLE